MRRAALILPVVVAVTFGACGGDDGDSDEDQVRDVVTALVTAGEDEVDCRERLSDSFVERTYGSRDRCVMVERDQDENPPDEVEFRQVSVDGDTASVEFEAVGGDADGVRGGLELVREDGDWRLEDYSIGLLRELVEVAVESNPAEDLSEPGAQCLLSALRELPDEEFRTRAYQLLGQTEEVERYSFEVLAECEGESGQSLLREVFEEGIRNALAERGSTAVQSQCVIDALREQIPDARLAELLGSEDNERVIGQLLVQAESAC